MDNETLTLKLQAETQAGEEYQKRRHQQWQDTYNLYRDIIETNALTQRQAVNIPIMKETKKTLLSRIDDAPNIKFYCLEDGKKTIDAKTKEININELWNDDSNTNNYEAIDILEKNSVLLFGRTHKKLNWKNNRVFTEVIDNLDILIDPKTNPINIDSAQFIVLLHIKRTVSDIINDPNYNKKGIEEFKLLVGVTTEKSQEEGANIEDSTNNANKMAKDVEEEDLGIVEPERLDGFEQEVEIREHFTKIWDEKKKKYIRYVVITAVDDSVILSKKTLKEALGIDEFWPFEGWADDLDAKDYWSDGIGDTVRVPNKIINTYFSQMIENRSYRNLGMKWYLPVPGYNPQTFEPEPFGQYPTPLVKDNTGRYMSVRDVIQDMQIPALEDNLVSIDFLIKLIERATSATAIEKGIGEKKQTTLGEVENLIAKSAETIASMAKFYKHSNKRYAEKWLALYLANLDKPIELFKKSAKGYFGKKITVKDIKSEKGYKIVARSKSEKDNEESETIQKMIAIRGQLPNNIALGKIIEKRLLDMLDLTSEEMLEIENENEQININNNPNAMAPPANAPRQGQLPAPAIATQ